MTDKVKKEQEIEFQHKCSDFVSREVYYCQSMLVDELLKKDIFSYDNVTNLYVYNVVLNKCYRTLTQRTIS
jgi:hypothetical protein